MNETEGKDIKMETNMGNMELLKVKEGKVFFEAMGGNIKIIHDDFLMTNLIEENSIDLIVTSPPYNVDIDYPGFRKCYRSNSKNLTS